MGVHVLARRLLADEGTEYWQFCFGRLPLNRDRVVHAAVAFADEHGVTSLRMRKLGDVLGVEAMSLYNHVANKSELLDGMVDLVFGEIGLPPAKRTRGQRCVNALSRRARSWRATAGPSA